MTAAVTTAPRGVLSRRGLGRRVGVERGVLLAVCLLPLAALAGGVVLAVVRGGVSPLVLGLAALLYAASVLGVTVGYHRLLTHGAFRAHPRTRVALAALGALALESGPITWVADHRRHHRYADQPAGDPHSPWRFGDDGRGLAKGLAWAHVGWLFDDDTSDPVVYAPDLLAEPGMVALERRWKLVAAAGLLLPALVAGAVEGWHGALAGLLWAGVVRVGVAHHVTFSVNSLCHVLGRRPFRTRDRSGNVGWLAALSMGESWHNGHHADPSCARHGVLPGQRDASAAVIRLLERVGLATQVRWPDPARVASRLVPAPPGGD